MLEILLLRPQAVLRSNDRELKFPTQKCTGVFLYLLLNRSNYVLREKLSSIYWSEFPPDRARKNLSDTIYRLKKTLKEEGLLRFIEIKSSSSCIQMQISSAVYLDLELFYKLVNKSKDKLNLSKRIDYLSRAIKLVNGLNDNFLLSKLDEEWVEGERRRFEDCYIKANCILIKLYRSIGEYDKALKYCSKIISREPFEEGIEYEYIRLLHLSGQRTKAVQEYYRFKKMMKEELRVNLSIELQNLYKNIRSNHPIIKSYCNTENLELSLNNLSLIDRHQEIKIFKELLFKGIRDNYSQSILLEGVSGIGKTRLLSEYRNLAEWHDLICISLRCDPLTSTPVFHLASLLIKRLLEELSISELNVLTVYQKMILNKIVPNILPVEDILSFEPMDKPFDQNLFYETVLKLLKVIIKKNPLIILIDDIQWVDQESLSLIIELNTQFKKHSFFLIMAINEKQYSYEKVSEFQVVELLNKGLQYKKVTVKPLSRDGIKSFLFHSFQIEAGNNFLLADEITDTLLKETGGNPLFMEEVLRLWLDVGILRYNYQNQQWEFSYNILSNSMPQISNGTGKVPGVLAEVFNNRIENLDDKLRNLLELLSVLGTNFRIETISSLSNISESSIKEQLGELAERGYLLKVNLKEFRFLHNQQRLYIYNNLERSKRKFFHQEIFNYLKQKSEHNLDCLDNLAWHSIEAGLWKQSVDVNMKCGNFYQQQGSIFTANYYYNQTLTIINQYKLALDYQIIFDSYWGRGNTYYLIGKDKAAKNDLKYLLELAKQNHDRKGISMVLAALARLSTRMGKFNDAINYVQEATVFGKQADLAGLLDCLHMFSLISQMSINFKLAKHTMSELKELLKIISHNANDLLIAKGNFVIGQHYLFLFGDFKNSNIYFNRAEKFYKDIMDKTSLSLLYGHLGISYLYQNKSIEGLQKLNYSVALARETGNLHLLCYMLIFKIIIYLSRGEYNYAYTSYLECKEIVGNSSYWAIPLLALGGELLMYLGDLKSAQSLLSQCLNICKTINIRTYQLDARATLGLIQIYDGSEEEGLKLIKTVLEDTEDLSFKWFHCKALLKCQQAAILTGDINLLDNIAKQLLNLSGKGASADMEGWAYYGLSFVELSKDNYNKSLHYLLKAGDIAEKVGIKSLMWQARAKLADMFLLKFNLAAAEVEYKKAAHYLEKIVLGFEEEELQRCFIKIPYIKQILLRGQSQINANFPDLFSDFLFSSKKNDCIQKTTDNYLNIIIGRTRIRQYHLAGKILELTALNREVDPGELAKYFDVHKRTIYRDLQKIKHK